MAETAKSSLRNPKKITVGQFSLKWTIIRVSAIVGFVILGMLSCAHSKMTLTLNNPLRLVASGLPRGYSAARTPSASEVLAPTRIAHLKRFGTVQQSAGVFCSYVQYH